MKKPLQWLQKEIPLNIWKLKRAEHLGSYGGNLKKKNCHKHWTAGGRLLFSENNWRVLLHL